MLRMDYFLNLNLINMNLELGKILFTAAIADAASNSMISLLLFVKALRTTLLLIGEIVIPMILCRMI